METTPIAKISINPGKHIWDRADFRDFLRSVNKDERLQKIYYIVTTIDPNEFDDKSTVNDIAAEFKIPSQNIFWVNGESGLVTTITALGVDFHFDGNSGYVDQLNLQLASQKPKFTAFFVNFIRDEYTQMMKYIDRFRFELNIFLNNQHYNRFD